MKFPFHCRITCHYGVIFGLDLLKKLIEQVKEYAKVEVPPKNEGKQIMMVLVPFNEK